MKNLIAFSILNGFVSAFLCKLMSDYVVSESFIKTDPSFDIIIGAVILFAILSSVGYIFTAKGQSIGKIWGAFGIEAASFVAFVIIDLVLIITGISISFLQYHPEITLRSVC